MRDIRKKLEEVRKVTGSRFSASNGYDLRKGLTKRQQNLVLKYYDMLVELTTLPHVEYKPKRGEKWEAISYAGQKGFPRFDRVFIPKVDPEAKLVFEVDKSRPKGSRFVVKNKKTKQAFYRIPASAFIDVQDDDLELEGIETSDFYREVLEQYAEDAELFLINAGGSYMWGSSGDHDKIADKIADLFRQYGSGNFNPADKNSHHFDNWFNGVTAFTRAPDAYPLIADRYRANEKRKEERHILTDDKFRVLRSGAIGTFRNGRLINTVPRGEIQPYAPAKPRKRRHRR